MRSSEGAAFYKSFRSVADLKLLLKAQMSGGRAFRVTRALNISNMVLNMANMTMSPCTSQSLSDVIPSKLVISVFLSILKQNEKQLSQNTFVSLLLQCAVSKQLYFVFCLSVQI